MDTSAAEARWEQRAAKAKADEEARFEDHQKLVTELLGNLGMRPKRDEIIVIPDPKNLVSDGGLHVVEREDEKEEETIKGTVLATGPAVTEDAEVYDPRRSTFVAPGQRIVMARYAVTTKLKTKQGHEVWIGPAALVKAVLL